MDLRPIYSRQSRNCVDVRLCVAFCFIKLEEFICRQCHMLDWKEQPFGAFCTTTGRYTSACLLCLFVSYTPQRQFVAFCVIKLEEFICRQCHMLDWKEQPFEAFCTTTGRYTSACYAMQCYAGSFLIPRPFFRRAYCMTSSQIELILTKCRISLR